MILQAKPMQMAELAVPILMDLLLEKVHKGGLDSLTPDERDTLERISQKRRSGRR